MHFVRYPILKTLLIIGGTGFFGKSFEDYYQRFSFENWGIGKLIITSRSKKKNKSNVEFVQFSSETSRYIPKADYIIYAASSSDSNIYINKSKEEYDSQKKSIEKNPKKLKKIFEPQNQTQLVQ